jgi:hydrogenase maturation factor
MHDATECGLSGAFLEVASSAGVRLAVDTDGIPIRPGVRAACDALGIDPWAAGAGGTLVIAVDPDHTAAVRDALDSRGTAVGLAGTVERGSGVVVDGEAITHPEVDPAWAAFEELAAESDRGEG